MVASSQQNVTQIDADLLRKVAEKDEAAFERFFDITKGRIWSYLVNMVGRTLADDMLQETYVLVWRFAGDQKNPENVQAWLYSIARNVAMSYLRKKSSKPMLSLTSKGPDDEGAEHVLPDRQAGPLDAAELSERALRVRAALDKLPIEQREVIVMKEYQDMKFEEIATMLDCPLGTVKSRMRYGTQKLAELLKELV